ncbi:MAG TPA: serine/threonine-protein kinase [Anaerolineaceae bacterium]|nr:serine/threonine-protein kinase [Anaerolineaceae bacterium]HOT25802.1 serine/threonine-protein kinase [Anaerolineaceae bacterium]HQH58422.1 serine/threonine-protein kinase [Anaerolineaceae bacterium]HQK03725.1 serine/threonine-protein kinase [Anaerolineaceae bacterium]
MLLEREAPMPVHAVKGEILHDRYRIDRIIGQGGYGCIYLAEDMRLSGRYCAVKQVSYDASLPPELLEESREQFLKEATVLARLDHPNLPKVSDYFSINADDYLVMDYVPGEDLRALVSRAAAEKRFLDEEDVLDWARQIADALDYLHNQQPPIVHRDIKPSNLKLTPSGLVKLVDFGLVKFLAPGEVTITILQGQGTAIYTPLEQYGGDSLHTDRRADIYAFGGTLYHLLTNQAPVNVRDRFLDPKSLPSPRSLNPAISPRVEEAVLWALQLHPDDRPADVRAFLKALTGETTNHLRGSLAGNGAKRAERMNDADWRLVAISAGLGFLSLLLTLLRNL